MDNVDYPPNIRKPVRDNHFAVTWGPGEKRHSDELARRVPYSTQTIVAGDRRSGNPCAIACRRGTAAT